MILICYDGSPDSKAAIEHAGDLLKGERATVLTVWEPFSEIIARMPWGPGMAPGIADSEKSTRPAARTRSGARERVRNWPERRGSTLSLARARRRRRSQMRFWPRPRGRTRAQL